MKAAAATFSINARPGSQGRTLMGQQVSQIFSPLKSSLLLLQDGELKVALLTSHFLTHYYRVSNILRHRVAQALNIPPGQVLCFSSHNHCAVKLNHHQYSIGQPEPDLLLPESELTVEGQELLESYLAAARRLDGQLVDVTIQYGVGTERRITYNRKGRRADGSTYLMREEDRLKLGDDFTGDIDDQVSLVVFVAEDKRPVAALAHFTGHPVTAFHCDDPIVHGEFPQVACDDLSAALGGIPVGFLQGCAGDINSKGLLSLLTAEENVRRAERYGHQLGETLQKIAGSLQVSERNDLQLKWREVSLPFGEISRRDELEMRLMEVDAFLKQCAQGNDSETRHCDGLNFPGNMTIPYRRRLIEPVRAWLQWCLAFHEEDRLHDAPQSVTLRTAVVRLGDVGIAGMPCEPLLGIGRQIRKMATLPLTLPCGYMNDTSIGYVPDSPNCGDFDYTSSFYRYTTTMLPYRKPAGDLLADSAAALLNQTLASPSPEGLRNVIIEKR